MNFFECLSHIYDEHWLFTHGNGSGATCRVWIQGLKLFGLDLFRPSKYFSNKIAVDMFGSKGYFELFFLPNYLDPTNFSSCQILCSCAPPWPPCGCCAPPSPALRCCCTVRLRCCAALLCAMLLFNEMKFVLTHVSLGTYK